MITPTEFYHGSLSATCFNYLSAAVSELTNSLAKYSCCTWLSTLLSFFLCLSESLESELQQNKNEDEETTVGPPE